MADAPPAAHRLPMLGCAALAAAALGLSACGGSGNATADDGATVAGNATGAPGGRAATRGAPGGTCPAQVGRFVRSLDSMRRQLAVGLSYEQYAAKVKALRRSYGEIPVARLTIVCLGRTGTPAEKALNEYIDGLNAWGECLADAACTTATIEPVLQRKWRVASRYLSEAQ